MTIADWSLLAAVLLYLLTVAPVKAAGYREFDNTDPRNPGFYRPGIRARALGAHLNGIETFPFFAAAVLLAEFRHAPQAMIDILAMGFIALRVLFTAAYLANRSTLRTLLWNAGFFVNVALFTLPLWRR